MAEITQTKYIMLMCYHKGVRLYIAYIKVLLVCLCLFFFKGLSGFEIYTVSL